jgi:MFS family permease
MDSESQRRDPFASARVPEFRSLLAGRFLFIMALRMMGTLVGWWMYNLTNAPFAIGLLGLAEVLPALSLALYAGHVIDISEKKSLLRTGMLLYLVCALILLFLSTHWIAGRFAVRWIALGIYLVIFLSGMVRSFTGPLFNVMLGQIVPKNSLQNAITWSQGTWLSASVTGHATGGFLIALLGNSGTLATVALLISLSLLILLRLKPKPPLSESLERKTWDSVREGIRFVLKTRELLGAMSLDLFAVFFGGAVAMVPVYARDILKIGAQGFGLLNGASDIGSIAVVVLLTFFPFRRQQGRKLLFVVWGFGTCIILFGLSKIFWVSFGVLLISGMLDGVSVVIRGTIMQLKTPDYMRGRVLSVNSMFINSSNELGQFESGLAAKLLGVVPSVVFGGCMTWLVVFVTWFRAPSLRKMQY